MKLRKRMEEIREHLRRFAAEEEILTAAGLGRWERVFALLDAMDHPMDWDAAGQCLEWALHNAPARVFARLLDKLPEGEYVGWTFIRRLPKGQPEDFCTEVRGSLTLLAAACGKKEHLKCLLDRGWDANSASPDAARSLRARASGHSVYQMMPVPAEPYSARRESMLRIMPENEVGLPIHLCRYTLWGVTPLAAAVACGRTGCARLLMARGAWREEAPSVARALMMRDRERDKRYQACRKAVLTEGGAPRPMALWAAVRACAPEQLEEELHRFRYSGEELARAVWELAGDCLLSPTRDPWWEEREDDAARLQVLARYAPDVLRQERQASLLLRWGIMQDDSAGLRDFLPELLPERVDLSLIREGLTMRPARKVSAFLRCVCQGRTCVMDRDSVPPGTPPLVLQTLLKYVTFLPPSSARGVSGLSWSLLDCGNLRLIRKALESGAIPPEESTGDLLRYLAGSGTAVRALLLTVRRPAKAGVWSEPRKILADCLRYRWLPEEVRGYQALLDRDCPEAEERELVACSLYDGWKDHAWETKDGVWHTNSSLVLMCLAGRSHTVERWVRCGPEDVLRQVFTLRPEGENYELAGTGLCIAAFAGQQQTVETLLKLGAEAEEQHMGMPGLLRFSGGAQELPVTPLLAALVRGRWETARLLLDYGAICDLGQAAVKALWRVFRHDDLTETVERHLNGYISRNGNRVFLTAKRVRTYNETSGNLKREG